MSKQKIGAIVVVLLVVAGVAYATLHKKGAVAVKTETTTADAVAVVNGVTIARSAYDTQLASAQASFKAQGVDTSAPEKMTEIKTQVLNDMIANELINQAVVGAGIKVTPEEVEAQFQAITKQAGGAEQLKTQMTAANITEAQVRDNILKQLGVQKYLLQNIDINSATTSATEIKAFYDANTKGVKNPPKLKDVSDQIKAQLIASKQQLLVTAFIASLRAKADIKTSL
jgi:hypothetical protein